MTRTPEDGDANKSNVDEDEGATSGGEEETAMTTDRSVGVSTMTSRSSDLLTPEAARNKIDEEREMMLLK